MDKCDTRLFDTEMAAGMDGIPNHLYALLQSGPGNDCGIRKEQQLIIGGNLHDSQMCQNLSFRQQSLFLVENGMKQIIRIDNTFIRISAPPSRTIRTLRAPLHPCLQYATSAHIRDIS